MNETVRLTIFFLVLALFLLGAIFAGMHFGNRRIEFPRKPAYIISNEKYPYAGSDPVEYPHVVKWIANDEFFEAALNEKEYQALIAALKN